MQIQISNIVALDEQGREFPKNVTLVQEENKNLIEFGLWERYNLDDLQGYVESPSLKEKFYLDLMGRNHVGSPVYITTLELRALLEAVEGIIS